MRAIFLASTSARPRERSTGSPRKAARSPRGRARAGPHDAPSSAWTSRPSATVAAASDEELHASPPANVDVVISFLFPKLIREPLCPLGRVGCLNFHPAPLPDYRGLGGYNIAILEGLRVGVSCHFVDERFDTGDLVEVERFPSIRRRHRLVARPREPGASLRACSSG